MSAVIPALVVKPGREKSLRLRHPWIFSGAIDRVDGHPKSGETVKIVDGDAKFLAYAAYSPESQIRARVWSFEVDEGINAQFFERRIERALAARISLQDATHTGARLIHAESDGLPGVIADRYGNVVVIQLLSAGADRWRDVIAQTLMSTTGARAIYERSDAEVRTLEGLTPRAGIISGVLPRTVTVFEGGLCYTVDVAQGQKTGFYLDQRDNRARVRNIAKDKRVLNAFCYTGGFSLAALAGGAASVLSIDTAADALALARENLARNPKLPSDRAAWREANVFAELRQLRDTGAAFDLIVLDPPKFAPTAAHVERAARAYKDINLWALKILAPGGLLATFSCSGGISTELFQKIIAGAAIDAGVDAAIIGNLSASADHPVALNFPEGEYLKGLLIRKSK
jgi:23S rRNA (cytosine1962-C5)-methyltransferase